MPGSPEDAAPATVPRGATVRSFCSLPAQGPGQDWGSVGSSGSVRARRAPHPVLAPKPPRPHLEAGELSPHRHDHVVLLVSVRSGSLPHPERLGRGRRSRTCQRGKWRGSSSGWPRRQLTCSGREFAAGGPGQRPLSAPDLGLTAPAPGGPRQVPSLPPGAGAACPARGPLWVAFPGGKIHRRSLSRPVPLGAALVSRRLRSRANAPFRGVKGRAV